MLAWHISHKYGEISAYENLALTNFYQGKIEKCKYYIDRKMFGKMESMFSIMKKISLKNSKRKYPNTKILPFKSEIEGASTLKSKEQNYVSLMSKTYRNYNIYNYEMLKQLGYNKEKSTFYYIDPTLQFIDRCSSISE